MIFGGKILFSSIPDLNPFWEVGGVGIMVLSVLQMCVTA